MKLTLAVVIVCCLSLLSFGQGKARNSQPNDSSERELLSLVKAWNDAELKGYAATIEKLLADEFSFLGGSNKVEYLQLMKPDESVVIESANIESSSVEIYGDAAVITSLNFFKLKKNGQPFEVRFLSMTVWIRKRGRWQCVKASLQPAKN